MPKEMMTKLEPIIASDVTSRIDFLDVSVKNLKDEIRWMLSSIDSLQDESGYVKDRLEALACSIEDMNDELEGIRFWNRFILAIVMLAIILLTAILVIALVLLQA